MYFILGIVSILALLVWYELSGKRAAFDGVVTDKEMEYQKDKPDLFWLEIWIESEIRACDLFTDESDFNRLWYGDTVSVKAKKGRLTGNLWKRRLIDDDFGRGTAKLS